MKDADDLFDLASLAVASHVAGATLRLEQTLLGARLDADEIAVLASMLLPAPGKSAEKRPISVG